MSCLNCRSMNAATERAYFDVPRRPYTHYSNSTSLSSVARSPCTEIYTTGNYSTTGWITPDYSRSTSGTDTSREGRGDPAFVVNDTVRTRKIASSYEHDTSAIKRHGRSVVSESSSSVENIRTRIKYLEDKYSVVHTRNQNLIAENDTLKNRLKMQESKCQLTEQKITQLQEELVREKEKLAEERIKREMELKKPANTVENSSSTTDIVKRNDRAVQNWSLCQGCQKKLEGCENEGPSVTITRSELEVLEKDMQALRDAVIAREEAWDAAMEREQTYRQQIARLTCEAITTRQLHESHNEELQTVTKTLMKKDAELKNAQKETRSLKRIISKLDKRCRSLEENLGGTLASEITEREQKLIEEIVLQGSANSKGKQKGKSKGIYSERFTNADVQTRGSPRMCRSAGHSKDHAGSSYDVEH